MEAGWVVVMVDRDPVRGYKVCVTVDRSLAIEAGFGRVLPDALLNNCMNHVRGNLESSVGIPTANAPWPLICAARVSTLMSVLLGLAIHVLLS